MGLGGKTKIIDRIVAKRRRSVTQRSNFNPARIMVAGFLAIILVGAALLKLPISSRDSGSVSFMEALFTATSATCVTGLVVVNTGATWSIFGKVVILCMIQIGGLGFMAITTIFFFVMNRKINLSQRLLIVSSMNLHDRQGIVGLVRHVLFGTFFFEGVGAVILWSRFYPQYGLLKGLGMGVFHSISAFCNAGFDLFGEAGQFPSLRGYSGDAVFTITVMLLVLLGGIGFFVWEDIWRNRSFRKLHLHSKLVLTTTLFLVVFGWVFLYIAERSNPMTIGDMPFHEAALASLFQAVTPRSSGFSLVDQSALTGISKIVVMIYMLIGGSAGSTAGGVKNVTAAILLLSALSSLRGKKRLTVFRRTIPEAQIISALSILIMSLAACFAGTAAVALIQPELHVSSIVFEMVSAVYTCGLSRGVTPHFVPVSMLIVTVFMFIGRVGIMTVGMAAFLRRNRIEKTKRPDTWVMM